jgi:hypothetical protein
MAMLSAIVEGGPRRKPDASRRAVFRRHDRRQRIARRRCQHQHGGAVQQVQCRDRQRILLPFDAKPVTVRFDVINLFDSIYLIRDGSGIGVFAPQYGPRRGYLRWHI